MEKNTLTLDDRKRITLTGVRSVDAFTAEKIKLTTAGGKLTVTGKNLKILSFSEQSGALTAEGSVDGMVYSRPKESVIARIFR